MRRHTSRRRAALIARFPARLLPGRLLLVVLVLAGMVLVDACTDSETDASSGSTTSTTSGSAPAPCAVPDDVATPVAATPVAGSDHDLDLTSFDGTRIRVHWFPQADATAADPLPTVLMGPGWGLAGDSDPEAVGLLGSVSIKSLHDAGYNVLTWDPRGFGASDGTAQVNFPGAEGRDVQQLIEWVSAQPGVELDGPSDPRMGMAGGSYGGGIQLIAASMDCRVDAIVPFIAWHSLTTSLFKADTVKQGWAGILTQVSTLASVDQVVTDSYQEGLSTGTIGPAAQQWYAERGPGDLVKRIKVPTLIIQGTVDGLFTLDEGVTNFTILRGGDVPVAMLWFCGGHGACFTDPGDVGRVSAATLAWLDRYVKRDDDAPKVATFDIVDQDGVRYTSDDLPEADGDPLTGSGSGTLQLTDQGGAGPATAKPADGDVVGGLAEPVTPAPAENAVDVRIEVPDGNNHLVVGAPSLEITYSGTVPAGDRPTRVFAQLVDDSTGLVLGNQITPIAVTLDGATHTSTVPLEWVAFNAKAGSTITLQLVATTVAYAPPRLGGQVDFSTIDISLPVVTGMQPG